MTVMVIVIVIVNMMQTLSFDEILAYRVIKSPLSFNMMRHKLGPTRRLFIRWKCSAALLYIISARMKPKRISAHDDDAANVTALHVSKRVSQHSAAHMMTWWCTHDRHSLPQHTRNSVADHSQHIHLHSNEQQRAAHHTALVCSYSLPSASHS